MPLELWNTIALVGTMVVISATAIAAVVQLRHLYANNQLEATLALMGYWGDPKLQQAIQHVTKELPKLQTEPSYVQSVQETFSLPNSPLRVVCTWWEQIGVMVKYGSIVEGPFLDIASAPVIAHWDALSYTIGIFRRTHGDAAWENFEYLAARAKQWKARHPHGNYPRSTSRLPVDFTVPT